MRIILKKARPKKPSKELRKKRDWKDILNLSRQKNQKVWDRAMGIK